MQVVAALISASGSLDLDSQVVKLELLSEQLVSLRQDFLLGVFGSFKQPNVNSKGIFA